MVYKYIGSIFVKTIRHQINGKDMKNRDIAKGIAWAMLSISLLNAIMVIVDSCLGKSPHYHNSVFIGSTADLQKLLKQGFADNK